MVLEKTAVSGQVEGILLGQLSKRAKYFKSPENPKKIE